MLLLRRWKNRNLIRNFGSLVETKSDKENKVHLDSPGKDLFRGHVDYFPIKDSSRSVRFQGFLTIVCSQDSDDWKSLHSSLIKQDFYATFSRLNYGESLRFWEIITEKFHKFDGNDEKSEKLFRNVIYGSELVENFASAEFKNNYLSDILKGHFTPTIIKTIYYYIIDI